ncbi:tetratricopeptide repeat protein [candidate division KSB1 bacterium]
MHQSLKISGLILGLALAAILVSCQSHYMTSARLYRIQNEHEEAIAQLKQEIETNPLNTEAYILLADEYVRQSRYGDAIREFEAAIKQDPEDPVAHFYLGRALLRRPDLERGIAELEAAVRLKPDYIQAYIELGKANIALGRFEAAVQGLETVLETDRFNQEALNGLGRAFLELGDYEAAAEHFQRLIVLEPGSIIGYFNLSLTHRRSGDTEQAMVALNEAMGVVRGRVRDQDRLGSRTLRTLSLIQLWIADYLVEADRIGEALDEYGRIMEDYSGSDAARLAGYYSRNLSRRRDDDRRVLLEDVPFYRQFHNYCGPAALAMALNYRGLEVDQLQIADEIWQEDGTLPIDMYRYIERQDLVPLLFFGNLERIRREIENGYPVIVILNLYNLYSHAVVVVGFDDRKGTIILHDPTRGERHQMTYPSFLARWSLSNYWAMVAYDTGVRPRPSRQEFRERAALRHYDIGCENLLQQKSMEALNNFKLAVGLYPNYFTALGRIGEIYFDQGRYELAQEYIEKAVKINPKYGRGYLWLALVYGRMGMHKEAERTFQLAARTQPGGAEIRLFQAKYLIEKGDYEGAERQLRGSERFGPGRSVAQALLGVSRALSGKNRAAERELKRAVDINPDNDVARSWLAYVSARRGRNDLAVDLCREVINHRPSLGEPHIFMAYAYADMGRTDEAIDHLRQAKTLSVAFLPARRIAESVQAEIDKSRPIPVDWGGDAAVN